MEKWEDIIKSRIDGYESILPEGAIAEFHALRSAVVAGQTKKAFFPIWAIATAVAAGIAALIFLGRPGTTINPADAPLPKVPIIAETAADSIVAAPVSLVPVTIPSVNRIIAKKDIAAAPAQEDDVVPDTNNESAVSDANPQTKEVLLNETKEDDTETETISIPIEYKKEGSSIKISPTKGGLLIAEGLASVATVFAFGDVSEIIQQNEAILPSIPKDYDYYLVFYHASENLYSYPIKIGLSIRIPITDRLSATTGIDYMRMRHDFLNTVSYYGHNGYATNRDDFVTRAQYLGVPLRIDWTLLSSRFVDLYLGAGIETDYCISATEEWNGNKYPDPDKDKWHLSAIATTGIQTNLTKFFGIYLEPGIAWNLTPGYNVLDNYRSQRKVMFSLATGVRFTL